MLVTTEIGVHWRVRPSEAESAGTGMWRALVRWPCFWVVVSELLEPETAESERTHLCAPDPEHDGGSGAVAHLLGEESGV